MERDAMQDVRAEDIARHLVRTLFYYTALEVACRNNGNLRAAVYARRNARTIGRAIMDMVNDGTWHA